MPAALQHTALSRRRFLVGSSALAAGAGFAGRSLIRPALAQARQPSDAAWRALADKLSGPVLRADSFNLAKVARSFNLRYARDLPHGVALCRGPRDVAVAILWCRENQFPLIVQSGGHSYAGFSMRRGGLMINLRLMRTARLENGIATVAGGMLNQDLYALLEQNNLAITHGRCPTVGAAGFVLGGGIGFNMRSNGVACDQLGESEVVTADGQIRALNPSGDDLTKDLYWASRGGGGGNFGVNTSFSLQTFAAEPVTVFDLTWTSATKNPDKVAAKLVAALEGAPIELGLGTRMSLGAPSPRDRAAGANVSISLIGQAKRADRQRLEALLADAYAEEKPQQAMIWSNAPYWSAQKLLEDDDGPTWFQERSTFAPKGKALEALDHIFGHLRTWPGTNGGADLRFFQTGGVMNRTPADATAFVHRDAEWIMDVGLAWDASDSWDAVTRARLWQDRFYDALRAFTVGAYQNFIDPSLTDWRTAYYGKNLARLEAIKKKIDPDRVFDFPQAI
jgi:hypothetical protein